MQKCNIIQIKNIRKPYMTTPKSCRHVIGEGESCVNTGPGNDLLPDGTKQLLDPILTHHQRGLMAFTRGLCYRNFKRYLPLMWVWDNKFKIKASSHRASDVVKLTFIFQESEPLFGLNTAILISGNLITIPIISGWLLTGCYQLSQAHLLPLTRAGWYKIGTSLWLAGEADSCNEGIRFLTIDQEKKSGIRVRFLYLTQIRASEQIYFQGSSVTECLGNAISRLASQRTIHVQFMFININFLTWLPIGW